MFPVFRDYAKKDLKKLWNFNKSKGGNSGGFMPVNEMLNFVIYYHFTC